MGNQFWLQTAAWIVQFKMQMWQNYKNDDTFILQRSKERSRYVKTIHIQFWLFGRSVSKKETTVGIFSPTPMILGKLRGQGRCVTWLRIFFESNRPLRSHKAIESHLLGSCTSGKANVSSVFSTIMGLLNVVKYTMFFLHERGCQYNIP